MSARIKQLWDEYAAQTMPPNASTVQRWETRRAFYAGALALFSLVTTSLPGEPEVSDTEKQFMGELLAELKQFAADVQAGRA